MDFDYSKLDYRKARLGDLKALPAIARELKISGTDRQIQKRLRRMILRPTYKIYVLTYDEDEVIALAMFRESHYIASDIPGIQVLGVAVSPEHQGHGAASSFMGLLAQEAVKREYSQLWFWTQVDTLVEFYEGLGFERSGHRFVMAFPKPENLSLRRRLVRRLGV